MGAERAASTLSVDRRTLLRLGLSSAVVAALPVHGFALAQEPAAQLLRFASDSPQPCQPERTGELSQAACNTLFALPRWVDRAWDLRADLDAYLPRLQADLGFKTGRPPSYLTEYDSAVAVIEAVVAADSSPDHAWAAMLFAERVDPHFEHTRLGRARRFVFGELIKHQIPLSGAFRRFGLVNYRGHIGGPFATPGSYRRVRR